MRGTVAFTFSHLEDISTVFPLVVDFMIVLYIKEYFFNYKMVYSCDKFMLQLDLWSYNISISISIITITFIRAAK